MFSKLTADDSGPECDEAFQRLKEELLNCAMLAHPDFSRPFMLSVDMSLDGMGVVLPHVPAGEDKVHPNAFARKTLRKSQQRYPAHRLKFMALKWSITEKFSHWLREHDFTVWTDNKQHAAKEQEHQACQYNKKVKGVGLDVEDRVLLANKGEHGKKKLADKWEPAVYTVVESNPKMYVYKISEVSIHCKVVHRNLLLDVNFLPVQDTLESMSLDISSIADDLSGNSEVDGFNSLGTESSQARIFGGFSLKGHYHHDGDSVPHEFTLQLSDNTGGLWDGGDKTYYAQVAPVHPTYGPAQPRLLKVLLSPV